MSQFLNSFLHVPPTALALGSSAIVKVLGQNDAFIFLGSLQQMAFASQKVLWRVPPTILPNMSPKWLLLQKRFCGGCPQLCFTYISQSELLTCLTHTNQVRRRRPIMLLLLGYSLGLLLFCVFRFFFITLLVFNIPGCLRHIFHSRKQVFSQKYTGQVSVSYQYGSFKHPINKKHPLSLPRPNFQTFWEPLGKTILRKPEKFELLFPGDLVG